MEYDKLRKKVNKFYIEKSIPKYQTPFGPLQRYNDVQMALEFAVATSCLKQTIEGDFNQVKVSEVQQLLQGNGSGRIQR